MQNQDKRFFMQMEKGEIFYNLNSTDGKTVKVAPGKAPEMVVPMSEDEGLLLHPPESSPFTYIPNTTGYPDGLHALRDLILATTPCAPELRPWIAAWIISSFVPCGPNQLMIYLHGSSGTGKSKSLDRIEALILGRTTLGNGTWAAAKRFASRNPVFLMDNIEWPACSTLDSRATDFLNLLASSGGYISAKGSDTLTIPMLARGAVSGIDRLPDSLPELKNRMFPIELKGKYRKGDYIHNDVVREILQNRDLIISSIITFIGKEILGKEQSKYYPEFRSSEHINVMMHIIYRLECYFSGEWSSDNAFAAFKDWETSLNV